jgi:hypothetical protein
MSSDALYIKRNRPVTTIVSASYTRPADTTAYGAGDVVANSTSAATVLTFSNIARGPGLGGVIQHALLIDSAAQSTKPDLELWLFDTAPTMQNDNAAWNPSDAELEALIGRIDFALGSFKTAGANGATQAANISVPFQCTAAVQAIYGVLVVRNAYTPVSAEKFTIRLHALQD